MSTTQRLSTAPTHDVIVFELCLHAWYTVLYFAFHPASVNSGNIQRGGAPVLREGMYKLHLGAVMRTWPVSSEFSKVGGTANCTIAEGRGSFSKAPRVLVNGIKTGALRCAGRNSPVERTRCHRARLVCPVETPCLTVEGVPRSVPDEG